MKLTKKANNPVYALDCLMQGLKLLTRPELRKFLLIPILINFILYSIVFALGYFYLSDVITRYIPSWLSWLEWVIWPLFFISFSMIGFFTFTVLANIIASPFYSKLAAKTLDIITEKDNNIEEVAVTQVVFSELKRAVYLLSRMLPLALLFIIPGLNLIAPVLWALFGAWGMGLEFMAYPSENKGVLFSQQKEEAKTQRIGQLSFGGLVVLGLMIPVFNLIVAPAAVIAATIFVHRRE